eukprot:CAMPEP_0175988376 /NCGR_PEP_ID=MMETSP0108-20121206/51218_1 /TAXON_ID=195067 ORGANISM="Goniomonas pacifica, Strain CCMP1869" /NCGR_SAMPLE_ID=MMETSP0108 /ASSEMBLY_ACC=CAM_ASM_000204 /LENGTH=82 /DNA_ID=CAMNT_0017319733 /DNA_START=108 /DNA_END=356 /DNA_ORIENTATION=-
MASTSGMKESRTDASHPSVSVLMNPMREMTSFPYVPRMKLDESRCSNTALTSWSSNFFLPPLHPLQPDSYAQSSSPCPMAKL